MKKFYLILSIAGLVIIACQQAPKPVPVDIEAEKAIINDMFETFNASRDADTLATYLTEDALCCGTDPAEFWTKQEMIEGWRQMLTPDVKLNFISERVVKVAPDGNSATVVDQYLMPVYSPNIPWRNSYHLVKVNGTWKIDFLSCSFIPRNEDIEKLNEVIQ